MVVCCLFVVVAIFCPILAYFFLIEALIKLRKMLLRKKLLDLWLENCLTLGYSYTADLLDLKLHLAEVR